MEIILKQDVQGLGYKNDVVKVKPGYGRNFLIPNGSALIANQSNKRMVEENVRQMAHKAAKIKDEAVAMAQKIGELTLELKTKAGETGIIFGAIYLGYCYYAGKRGLGFINHDAHLWGAVYGFFFTILLKPYLIIYFLKQLPFLQHAF